MTKETGTGYILAGRFVLYVKVFEEVIRNSRKVLRYIYKKMISLSPLPEGLVKIIASPPESEIQIKHCM